MQVVPLFETIADLEASPAILDAYLGTAWARRSLALQRDRRGASELVQEVMSG